MAKEKLNELNGKTWLQYSITIWKDIRKTPEEAKLGHPAVFPTALTSRIIDIFTKKGAVVIDPFMGSGSTIISAFLKSRKGIGFELSEEYIKLTKKRLNQLGLKALDPELIKPEIYHEDARNLLKYIKPESVDLCITSPPYWDILKQPRSADRKEIVSYSNLKKDLGNIKDYNEFLEELKLIFSRTHKILKVAGYCVVVVMDIRKKNKFYPFHSDLADKMKELGFSFEDIIIWDRQHEYNNLRPLGYPYVFRANKVHEYILMFRKFE